MKNLPRGAVHHSRKLYGVLVLAGCICLLLISMAKTTLADEPRQGAVDLTQLSLEDLMNLEVTSVSKHAEKLSKTPAAVYVITQEDLRRSGAGSIPEALRMVPGLDVARIGASQWAISSRGFNKLHANKMLVLIDGRSVYTPLFSGVHWNVQDTLMEDIERIEVIRGPGATMWGANAVNGIINIITKDANDSQGVLVAQAAGRDEINAGNIRYGAKIGDSASYRFYAKQFNRDNSVTVSGDRSHDEWNQHRTGFRIDWNTPDKGSVTLQGDAYNGHVRQTLKPASLSPPYSQTIHDNTTVAGQNLLTRWKRVFSDTSDMVLQLYYDRTERERATLKETRETFDLDFNHSFAPSKRHKLMWGLGYRLISDKTTGSFAISFDPPSQRNHVLSAFVQDEITLSEDRLHLALGSKLEHNPYTGSEVQPGARLLWMPEPGRTAWAAVSRAARTPSRSDRDMHVHYAVFQGSDGTPVALSLLGNKNADSEKLTAYELGYRTMPNQRFSLDVAAFYNVYDKLMTIEPGTPFIETSPSPSHLAIPLRPENMMDGESHGIEVAANWDVTDRWRLTCGYTWLQINLRRDPSSKNANAEADEGKSPRNQFHLLSYLDLPKGWEFDTALYYVDSLPAMNIPSYVRLDIRLGWQPTESTSVSIGVQNLLDDRHLEFEASEGAETGEIERNVYGEITWRF